jgi:hypothetical protein
MRRGLLISCLTGILMLALPINTNASLIASYTMDEGQGTVVSDSSGNGNNGLVSRAAWCQGHLGSSLDFNGQGGHIAIPNSQSLDIHGNAITLSAWFKMSELNDDGAFVFRDSQYFLRIDNVGRLCFVLYLPVWTEVKTSWADRIVDNNWHHTVAVYDGAEMSIYLDGVSVAHLTAAGNIQQKISDIWIGSQAGGYNQFGGLLDEVKIYNNALNSSQILAAIPEPGTICFMELTIIRFLMKSKIRGNKQ